MPYTIDLFAPLGKSLYLPEGAGGIIGFSYFEDPYFTSDRGCFICYVCYPPIGS